MELSGRLRSLRASRGWSQADLARAAGIPQPDVSRLESGDIKQPKMETLLKIAKALGISCDYLASGSESLEDFMRGQRMCAYAEGAGLIGESTKTQPVMRKCHFCPLPFDSLAARMVHQWQDHREEMLKQSYHGGEAKRRGTDVKKAEGEKRCEPSVFRCDCGADVHIEPGALEATCICGQVYDLVRVQPVLEKEGPKASPTSLGALDDLLERLLHEIKELENDLFFKRLRFAGLKAAKDAILRDLLVKSTDGGQA